MDVQSLSVVVVLFLLSLLAAVVVFKGLENTAIVKLPFGQFTGAVAGLIGFFLVLLYAYKYLNTEGTVPKITLPSGYKEFISSTYHIGLGYSKADKFIEAPYQYMMLGAIQFEETNAKAIILVKRGEFTRVEDIIRLFFSSISREIDDTRQIELTRKPKVNSYSVGGALGQWAEGIIRTGDSTVPVVFVSVPHSAHDLVYIFVLGREDKKPLEEKDKSLFKHMLSTVQFLE